MLSPFADFLYFGLLLYVVVPTVILGLFGRANARWALLATVLVIGVQSNALRPGAPARELWLIAAYALYQGALAFGYLRVKKTRVSFWAVIGLSILPLVASKLVPTLASDHTFGFLGISYVTFRALDVLFSVHDRVVTALSPGQYLAFLFLFPTVSSGPIDRYRRFGQDWKRIRTRADFLDDLDAAIQRIFQGFLYKFIIAALVKTYWVDHAGTQTGLGATASYMYAYTFYLFFDFAGYSAFAIGFSRLFGIKTPENFDRPFLSRNIRDFWNRWHISLSFWFRDHIYMRFLLAAGKGKWFQGRHTASYLGLFLTFGIMGVWHGLERHYLLYGAYHAALLSGYDAFARWNKQRKWWPAGPLWRVGNIMLTFHAITFGLLIFSGRLIPPPPPAHAEVAEKVTCEEVVGWAWERGKPNEPLTVDILVDTILVGRVKAGDFREDLKERGLGDGRRAFRFAIPPYVRDGQAHTVEARVLGSGRMLHGTPEVVTCPVP